MYSDNQKKCVVVMNRRHPTGLLLNAYGHLVLGLAADLGASATELLNYCNGAAGLRARISRYPVIALGAKNSNQIRTTYEQAVEFGLAVNVFVTTMLGKSATAQLANTAEAFPDDLDYVGLVMFGDDEELKPLTKRFSLLSSLS